MTSLEPLVRVWRHVSWAVEPAATLMTAELGVVGLGPPLQAMSLEVTSVMGWEGREIWDGIGEKWLGLHHRMMGPGYRSLRDCR